MTTVNPEAADQAAEALSEMIQEISEFFGEHESLVYMIDEFEAQKELIEKEMYVTALMRQSTFFESLLTTSIQLEVEDRLGKNMSNSEKDFLTYLSPRGKVHFAFWFELISEKEREALLELMHKRNTVAHKPWEAVKEESSHDIKRLVNRIHSHMEEVSNNDWEIFE